ncbi:hypothetical protein PoB_003535100 [Plakobranchus ocellatus]|uniref:Uncharacterized protein n=1 Tax=Plakobranchus ocellatus TaxID=259542 RepID=A0AAV4ACI6_9GAST|nr:hypothetical protein PoB_003535100 [Plakobranchus ocellatus]
MPRTPTLTRLLHPQLLKESKKKSQPTNGEKSEKPLNKNKEREEISRHSNAHEDNQDEEREPLPQQKKGGNTRMPERKHEVFSLAFPVLGLGSRRSTDTGYSTLTSVYDPNLEERYTRKASQSSVEVHMPEKLNCPMLYS